MNMSEQSFILDEPDQSHTGPWRNEVQERLQRYKTKRGRRVEGAFTMRFPFPPQETERQAPCVVAVEQPESSIEDEDSKLPLSAVEEEPERNPITPASEVAPVEAEAPPAVHERQFELEPEPAFEIPPELMAARPRPRRKVIAFPRPAYSAFNERQRLADPVITEQLRITEVPEELEAISATPFLDGLLDPPAGSTLPASASAVELPFVPATGWMRAQAALVDLALLAVGGALFAASAYRFLQQSIPIKFAIVSGAAVAVLLWAVYQYLLVVYGGRTIGMRAARLRLCNFKGATPGLRQRRLRVLSMYLSVLSLGMGVLWSLVDIDSLCWHDRMSQSFLAAKN
jgi:uncharacterized RDD family membrane protein YckC